MNTIDSNSSIQHHICYKIQFNIMLITLSIIFIEFNLLFNSLNESTEALLVFYTINLKKELLLDVTIHL